MAIQQLTTFQEFVKDKYVIIPRNQRGYAWKKENFDQLVDDVQKLPEEYVHYAGPILFLKREGTSLLPSHARVTPISIEDGQQRSTTLFLIARVLLDYFQENLQDDKHTIQALENTIFQINRGEYIRRLRSENPVFDSLIRSIIEKDISQPALMTSSMKRLAKIFEYIKKHIGAMTHDAVSNLFDDLFNRLRFVAIDLMHEQVNASIAFHTTNSRGVPLKSFDIVKNHLMYYVEQRNAPVERMDDYSLNTQTKVISKSDVEEAWFKAIEWLEEHKLGDKEDEFLGFCTQLLIATNGKLERQELPKIIEEYFYSLLEEAREDYELELEKRALEQVKKFTSLWESLVENYGLILNQAKLLEIFSGNSAWSNWAHSVLKIHALKKPGILNEILTVSRIKFSPKENEEIADLAYKLIFRVYAVQKGRRVDHKATSVRKMVNDIFAGRVSAQQVQEFLVGVIIESGAINDCIRQLFGESPLLYSSKKVELGWFLTEYEYFLCNAHGTTFARFDKGGKTIEHILPQEGSTTEHHSYYQLHEEWRDSWSELDFRLCKHRCGNLVLTNHNSVLGDKPYSKKCVDSGYCYSSPNASKSEQELVELFPKWDLESLHHREARLMGFFLRTFRVEHPSDFVDLQLSETMRSAASAMNVNLLEAPAKLRFSHVEISDQDAIDEE